MRRDKLIVADNGSRVFFAGCGFLFKIAGFFAGIVFAGIVFAGLFSGILIFCYTVLSGENVLN